MIDPLFDPLLAIALLGVAAVALHSRDLFRGIVLYIVFGLLMALAWVRLHAPDLALAEAAIGAGITGALLLDTMAQLGRGRKDQPPSRLLQAAAFAAVAAFAAIALSAVLALPRTAGGLTTTASAFMEDSGVESPVTAVLLNFRAWDTWLEVAVLLVAVISVLVLARRLDLTGELTRIPPDPLLTASVRLLIPIMVLTGGYLLWRGTHAPGGAFQAGAVLGSGGVLLLLAGFRPLTAIPAVLGRAIVTAGLFAFTVAAAAVAASSFDFLRFGPAHAGSIIVAIELAVTISIAVTLIVLFAAAREVPVRSPTKEAPPYPPEAEGGR